MSVHPTFVFSILFLYLLEFIVTELLHTIVRLPDTLYFI